MIKIFSTDLNEKLNEISEDIFFSPDFNYNGCWVDIVNPTDKEVELLCEKTGISEELLKAPLDAEERSRLEKEDDCLLTLIDIPTLEEEEGYYSYSTLPMGIIVKDNLFVTVCLKESVVMRDFYTGRVKNFATFKKTRFLFQILYNNSTKYLHYLKQIDKASNRIQNELHKSTRNKELIQLLDLENSLVYFSTSLKGNDMVISKLTHTSFIKKYEEDQDLIEDVEIENKQAIEMCNIYRDILSGTMDAFASVISNNQNNVMKILTSITLVMAIPTLIASFFGMNTGVPWENKISGFWIVVGISVAITVIMLIVLFKKKTLK